MTAVGLRLGLSARSTFADGGHVANEIPNQLIAIVRQPPIEMPRPHPTPAAPPAAPRGGHRRPPLDRLALAAWPSSARHAVTYVCGCFCFVFVFFVMFFCCQEDPSSLEACLI